ncbi:uncharacterized protein [Palaemon carinicauda]|uniref:uncharacterized protein n=1 Tax=Palaemon carinicauda TaxID=392227 RepID=UPI0035B68A6E
MPTKEEHWRHVRAVLKRLQENGLIMPFDKCTFGAKRVDFLGHQKSSASVKPITTKVDAVKTFPTPTTIRYLQEFLGMVSYYRPFIPNIAHILIPLNDILKGKAKRLVRGPLQQCAFDKTKAALGEATTLVQHVRQGVPCRVPRCPPLQIHARRDPLHHCDRPPAPDPWFHEVYRRMVLSPTETPGSHRGIWQHYQLRTGKEEPITDALSRIEIKAVHLGIDYHNLALEQQNDPEAQDYHTTASTLQMKDIPLSPAWKPSSVTPAWGAHAHGFLPPVEGRSSMSSTDCHTLRVALQPVYYLRNSSGQRLRKTPVSGREPAFTAKRRRFRHIHVDLEGPLPPSGSAKYILTIVDRSTKWLEATPMSKATTHACAEALLSSWIRRFGVPDDITVDRGSAFLSEI